MTAFDSKGRSESVLTVRVSFLPYKVTRLDFKYFRQPLFTRMKGFHLLRVLNDGGCPKSLHFGQYPEIIDEVA
jgi:hypothetical protein